MNRLQEYEIPFVGLKLGVHEFQFVLDKNFFSQFENSPIEQGRVEVKLRLEKRENMMVLEFGIDGMVLVECDRCLELFEQDIFGDYSVYVKFEDDESKRSDSEEVVYLYWSDTNINVAQLIYEYTVLSIPMFKVHPEDENGKSGCDPEVLERLSASQPDKKEDNADDPRWEALKKLK